MNGPIFKKKHLLQQKRFYGIDPRTPAADLPVPLHSARMDLLAGVPTLIGGYDGENERENDVIYQYNFKNDSWEHFGKLNEGRSSPTVVQVPHFYFPFC